MSAQLGRANKGTGYVLQRAPARGRRERLSRRGQTGYSFKVRDDDDKGLRALDELKARGIIVVANTIARSVENVVTFFNSLRSELAFYWAHQSAVCLGAKRGADLHPSTNARRQRCGSGRLASTTLPQSP